MTKYSTQFNSVKLEKPCLDEGNYLNALKKGMHWFRNEPNQTDAWFCSPWPIGQKEFFECFMNLDSTTYH
jgi:hypothetical protein